MLAKKISSKTFRRLSRKTIKALAPVSEAKKTEYQTTIAKIYSLGGKSAVLDFFALRLRRLQGAKNPTRIKLTESTDAKNARLVKESPMACDIPPSMPKGAAAKIAKWEDKRVQGGEIEITLLPGFYFDAFGSAPLNAVCMSSAISVKDAIVLMRTVKAV
jgi:hypothetical protein